MLYEGKLSRIQSHLSEHGRTVVSRCAEMPNDAIQRTLLLHKPAYRTDLVPDDMSCEDDTLSNVTQTCVQIII